MKRKSETAGFTLIEVLVVIAIIGILMMLLVPAVGRAKDAARRGVAKQDIMNLRTALAQYELEQGAYPPDTVAKGGLYASANANLVYCLSQRTIDGPGSYMEFKQEQVSIVGAVRYFQDCWGNDYRYIRLETPDTFGRLYYIYSMGPNGLDECDDNVKGGTPNGILTDAEISGDKGDDLYSW